MEHVNLEARTELYKAILSLQTEGECAQFFEDLFTINELDSACQRIKVAKMLRAKKTMLQISKQTGASTATITRVNKCLQYGNGYKTILERLN